MIRKRRTSGLSLLELLFTATLIVMLMLSMGAFAQTAIHWNEAADRAILGHSSAETLRRNLGAALLSGTPLDQLAVGQPPMRTWSTEAGALIVRASDAYWVVEREGSRVVRRRIGFDGRVDAQVVVTGVTAIGFELVKKANLVVGLAWKAQFVGSASPATGFLALRVDEIRGAPPSAPVPAPRLDAEGEKK